MIRYVALGAAGVIVAGLVLVYFAVILGLMPANADAKPSALERWAAGTSLRATVAREGSKQVDPLPADDTNLTAGVKLYAANCMVCHGASDGQASNVAAGLYQHAPQLGKHGVEDDPEGATYWIIAHGIRLTGMPSFGKSLTDTQLWQLATFLKHMDSLPPKAQAAWKKLPSQTSASRSPLGTQG
jgi:thiosulfate dehydrogenase